MFKLLCVFQKAGNDGQRFCITRHKLGFYKEIGIKTVQQMMNHFFADPDGEFFMSRCTFMMNFDFTTDFAVVSIHFAWKSTSNSKSRLVLLMAMTDQVSSV